MVKKSQVHGGDIFAAARELNLGWEDILDFSANVNPLGPPPGLKRHLFNNFRLVESYPDPFALGWRTELAARHNLLPGQVLTGNGTTSLIYLLVRVLCPKNPVIVSPAFGEYEQALAQVGVRPKYINCRLIDEFDLTAKVVDRVFDLEPDLVFLANPTSPAGRLIDPEVMDLALARAGKCGSMVILDEAFLDFVPARSMSRVIRKHRRLVVLRSLTKFYGLPGLRLGYLTASSGLVKRLMAGFEPWSVNALAQAAGLHCLDQEKYAARTRTLIARERAWLAGRLTRTGLGRVIPSAANYLLVKLERPGLTVDYLAAGLKKQGILVRDCASFQGLLKGYVRVAVKTRRSNTRLVRAVEETLAGEIQRLKPDKFLRRRQ